MACSYLISECGWTASDALARFTERRMRPGFGPGVSIPSQLRWVDYVTRWTKHGKKYVERQVEIVEIHVWGLRDGVKVAVEGYVEDGRVIKNFRTFDKDERTIVENIKKGNGMLATLAGFNNVAKAQQTEMKNKILESSSSQAESDSSSNQQSPNRTIPQEAKALDQGDGDGAGQAVIFKSRDPLVLPTNDINIDFERRNKASYGWSMLTSIAHVWFNAFFEGDGAENDGEAAKSGVFEIDWDKMDGIKGSSQKGTRSIDRLSVLWKIYEGPEAKAVVINEPAEGEEVKQMKPADWKGGAIPSESLGKALGLRSDTPEDANASKANSIHSGDADASVEGEDEPGVAATKVSGLHGEDHIAIPESTEGGTKSNSSPGTPASETQQSPSAEGSTSALPTPTVSHMGQVSTGDLPGGVPENDMKTVHESILGSLGFRKE
jgi:protein-tyrosine phosphatase